MEFLIAVDMQTDFINGSLQSQEGKRLPVEHYIKDTDGWQILLMQFLWQFAMNIMFLMRLRHMKLLKKY